MKMSKKAVTCQKDRELDSNATNINFVPSTVKKDTITGILNI